MMNKICSFFIVSMIIMASSLLIAAILLLSACEKDNTNSNNLQGVQNDNIPSMVSPKSYFIVNEDRFGLQNGTVNRLWLDKNITYRAFRKANSGAQLGITTQFAMIYGSNIYFMSKQGERLVVADAETLKKKASFSQIGNDNDNGRACVGVDDKTIYISTNNGIKIFDIPSLGFIGSVNGIEDYATTSSLQVGDMLRIGNRVFAALQGSGILVINTNTHTVDTIVEPKSTGAICQSKNGWLWVSGNPLKAYNPYTLEIEKSIQLTLGNNGGGVNWGTWRSGSLCSSTQFNTIYWLNKDIMSWNNAAKVIKYDIDNDLLSSVMELNTYGTIRIDPITNYITTVEGTMYNDNGSICRKFNILGGSPDINGNIDESQPYLYWFPSMPVFEDVNRPVVLTKEIVLSKNKTLDICLSDMVFDHDNNSKSILKEIIAEPNSFVKYKIGQDTLHIKSFGSGETFFLLKINSNGFSTERRISVKTIN